jgi:hypothetical protein
MSSPPRSVEIGLTKEPETEEKNRMSSETGFQERTEPLRRKRRRRRKWSLSFAPPPPDLQAT